MTKKSSDRFYLLPLGKRPAMFGDLGSHLQIAAVTFEGNGQAIRIHLPHANKNPVSQEVEASLEDWSDIIQHSDDPAIFELDDTGGVKAIHRKVRYQISGQVQQGIWARDNCACMFCGRKIGEVLLTIDHYYPLELGGKNDTSNYLTACKKCNKKKANNTPEEHCIPPMTMHDHEWYVNYLKSF